jgi:hypothetical protein
VDGKGQVIDPTIIRESIEASATVVESLARLISRLPPGRDRMAAIADAQLAFAKAAAKLDVGPDATFLWKEAHVAELHRLIEEIERG